ncbi:MAG: Beta-galactosidase [Anaerolineales bacterium]|nr:Beta-galactosidase [Anaerolineales bacterium]
MMHRPHTSLDGQWEFWADPENQLSPESLPAEPLALIDVPAPWQSQSPELRFYTGRAWYRRTVEVPADWLTERVFLGLGAVDYHADVWVNDVKIGYHEGGYLPFEFDITSAAWAGTNTITICVDDPNELFPEIPHGKQSWYGQTSGIWQSVWLARRPALHVQSVRLTPDLPTGRVDTRVSLSEPAVADCAVEIKVLDPEGDVVASSRLAVTLGMQGVEMGVTVDAPLSWSPDHPHLYACEVRLYEGQALRDACREQFGFRTIEARDGRLFLNGEPLYLRGALDQDYYPGTICTPPSEEFLEDQIRKAKELGLNCLRCHIKIADPRYYAVADRLGMLIWTELPNWHLLTDETAQRARATLQGMVERDGNYPSIIAWTIINEDWGTDLVHDATHRAWLKDTYQWLKALDPTRLVVDNSPCWPNFHIQTDLEDYHHYRAIPDHRAEWDEFVGAFATRPVWTFSPSDEAVRSGDEPLIVSEFGNWGLPDVDLLLDAEGREPWWFETGLEWGDGVVYPHGVRRRFHRWHLDRVFGTWREFVEATQWQQYNALKYEIESMRRHPEIAGYVITELTDVHWECNGLLDMRRNPKVFQSELAAVNADTMVIPAWERVAYWAGEPIRIEVSVAHGAGRVIEESEVHWSTSSGAAGRAAVPALHAGQVEAVDAAAFSAPKVTAPGVHRLELELRSPAGRRLASNHLDLSIFPKRRGPVDANVFLWASSPELTARLVALDYNVVSDPQSADVIVAHKLDEELGAYVRQGGRLLLLAGGPDAIESDFAGVRIKAREGTPWSGDWASSFAWLRREGPFQRLPGGPLLDFAFDGVTPECVLVGFTPWDFEARVHAGIFVGWIHKPAALIAERRYGRGRAVLTTFRLTTNDPGSDPTATTLLDALIELALST